MANWLAAVGQGLGEATKNISALMTDEKQREAVTQNIAASKTQQAISEAELAEKQRQIERKKRVLNPDAWIAGMPEKAQNHLKSLYESMPGFDKVTRGITSEDFEEGIKQTKFMGEQLDLAMKGVATSYSEEIIKLDNQIQKIPDPRDPKRIELEATKKAREEQLATIQGHVMDLMKTRAQEAAQTESHKVERERIASNEKIAEEGRKTQKEIANTPQRAPQLNPLQQLEYDTVKGMSEQERKQYFLNKGLKANLPEVIQSKKDEAVSKSVDKHMSGWISLSEKNTKEVDAAVRRKIKATGAQNPDQRRAETILEYYRDEATARQSSGADISYFGGYRGALGISNPGTIQVAYPKGSSNMVTVPVPTSGRMRPDNLEAYAYYYLDELKKKQGK